MDFTSSAQSESNLTYMGDHMDDFSTSLGGEIVMTEPTRLLLEAQYPALEFCAQIHTLGYGELWQNEGITIETCHEQSHARCRTDQGYIG